MSLPATTRWSAGRSRRTSSESRPLPRGRRLKPRLFRSVWIPALRRFALLVGAIGGGTVLVSVVLGLLLGASLPRSIALGYYLVGSFLLLAGFFFGNRGPVRPRGDADHGDFFMRPRGRRVRWATREEHEEAINSSALFVVLGLLLIFLGLVSDNRHALF
jgi:hypothetical protein